MNQIAGIIIVYYNFGHNFYSYPTCMSSHHCKCYHIIKFVIWGVWVIDAFNARSRRALATYRPPVTVTNSCTLFQGKNIHEYTMPLHSSFFLCLCWSAKKMESLVWCSALATGQLGICWYVWKKSMYNWHPASDLHFRVSYWLLARPWKALKWNGFPECDVY